ncbi:MAG TPA: ABC transporter substrate-binding protein, partial [Thermomicrobiales bacterium]|nr:ABC transporter substrate-binding protein [Thermomicrobiales bacterium]
SATGALLPKHLLQDVSPADVQKSPFARKPVYTGPFMVQSWQTGEGLTFAAFPDAFAGPPTLATLVGRDYPDQTTAINALRTGESQLGFVAPDQFDQFARDPTFRTQQLAGSQGVFLTFDLTNPLFADKRVRQAISHAIDRKALIAALFRGKADPSFGVASPLSWLYNPDAPRFDFDVAQAKQLLDAAGWQPGADGIRAKDGKKFSFTMDVVTGGAATQDVVALQPFLKAVGIEFQINELEFGTYIARHVVGKYEASYFSWANFIIDPREDLQEQFESPRAADYSGYDNAQVNQLFQQARAATSRDDEKKLYDQIQQITGDDAVYVYLWRPQPLLVARNTLALPTVKIPAELFARAAEWATSAER